MPKESCRLRMTREDLRLILEIETVYNNKKKIAATTEKKTTTTTTIMKTSKLWERFKCSVFNQKTTRHTKKQKNNGLFRVKHIRTENVPEKHLMKDPLDKDVTITALQVLKELKEDMEKS